MAMDGPFRIAVAGCKGYPDDPDWRLLSDSLAALGVTARLAAWDDPAVDWASFDLVVIRSTWDYATRPDDYLAWAQRVARLTTLANPIEVIRWNIDKSYLADLGREGISVLPTTWVEPGDEWEPPPGEFVVKPAISAGAIDTARYGPPHHAEARTHLQRLQGQQRTAMVQPYAASVDERGELAMIFVGGSFSHAVRKTALLTLGEGAVVAMWERTVLSPGSPNDQEQAFAAEIVTRLRHRFGEDLLFCRIDLIDDSAGRPIVLEVELIEPCLFFTEVPGAAERFAIEVARVLTATRRPPSVSA
jgi:glutathione synthase/RimK-type ligase-like ATP-grasp enzyme